MVPPVLKILKLVRDQLEDHLDVEYNGESIVAISEVHLLSVRALVSSN